MAAEVQAAVNAVRSVTETIPYDAVEAARVLHRTANFVPPHVAPFGSKSRTSGRKVDRTFRKRL